MVTVPRILLLYIFLLVPVDAYFGLSSTNKIYLDTNSISKVDHKQICLALGLTRYQMRMCYRSWGIAKTLVEAYEISRKSCRKVFKFSRWTCPDNETYRLQLVNREFKETAFLFAISSASLVHAVAHAYSNKSFIPGKPEECFKFKDTDIIVGNLQRNICSPAYQIASHFVQKFLRVGTNDSTFRYKINAHNIKIGLKAVRGLVKSKAIAVKDIGGSVTLYRYNDLTFASFDKVTRELKKQYKNAIKYNISNASKETIKSKTLVFTEEHPDLCKSSEYWPGVKGRVCYVSDQHRKRCDKMCCGRAERNTCCGGHQQTRECTKHCKKKRTRFICM